MYNLRYHIASLVAVFLSLSIGLLLGTIVVERGTLDRQKEAIVTSLQEEFRTLDGANSELRERATSREELVGDLLPHVVAGELAERQILVVVGAGRVDGLAAVTESIRLAGGSPVVMVLSSPEFGLADPEVSSVVTATVSPGELGGTDLVDGEVVETAPLDPDELFESVVARLAEEWATPAAERALTVRLAEAGVLRIDGDMDPALPADGVVTLAALSGVPERGALSLARAFAERDLPAVGVEAMTQSTGVASAAVEEGLSAVDHMGSDEGTFSLVFLLADRASGYFGLREGATAAWPR